MDEIIKKLVDIGLQPREAEVLLSLIYLGQGTAYEIARVSKISRSSVYIILDSLFIKGLILKIPNIKKQIFIAKDLEEFILEKEEHISAVKQLLPKINKIRKRNKPKVLYFDGLKGLNEAMYYKFNELKNETFYSFYSNLKECNSSIIKIFNRWNVESREKNIKFKILAPLKDSEDFFKSIKNLDNVEIKFLDLQCISSDVSFEINKYFVRLISLDDFQTTIIDNKKISNVMQEIFKLVWKKS